MLIVDENFNIEIDSIRPEIVRVANQVEIPEDRITDRHRELIVTGLSDFDSLAEPQGVISEVVHMDFDSIFQGEGLNDSAAPLEEIKGRADRLALCATTIGQPLCDKIGEYFKIDQFAQGSILDAVASIAADNAITYIENYYFDSLPAEYNENGIKKTLCYSPGYCGWHVTAQRKLFAFLKPSQIGITLKTSCLMEPLKSISGVLITADKTIHEFDNSFSFCADCPSQPCLERMK